MSSYSLSTRLISERVIAPGNGVTLVSAFYSSGTFVPPPGVTTIGVLIVSGGGGGGANACGGNGGGGAGGYVQNNSISVEPLSSYTIYVGGGGSQSSAPSFGYPVTSTLSNSAIPAGGQGGNGSAGYSGFNGGSGGGGAANAGNYTIGQGGSAISGNISQPGYNGGNSGPGEPPLYDDGGGGGGGLGSAGSAGLSGKGGNGGAAKLFTLRGVSTWPQGDGGAPYPGQDLLLGGGGGGGSYTWRDTFINEGGTGGIGGGAGGYSYVVGTETLQVYGDNGTANTGSGAGGNSCGGYPNNVPIGGSGVVLVYWGRPLTPRK